MRGAEGAIEDPRGFSPLLGAQAVGVGALTSLIGAGGGFVVMPALTLLGAHRAWRCPTFLTKDSTLMLHPFQG